MAVNAQNRDVWLSANIGYLEPCDSPWHDTFEVTKRPLFGWPGSLSLVVRHEEGYPACSGGQAVGVQFDDEAGKWAERWPKSAVTYRPLSTHNLDQRW